MGAFCIHTSWLSQGWYNVSSVSVDGVAQTRMYGPPNAQEPNGSIVYNGNLAAGEYAAWVDMNETQIWVWLPDYVLHHIRVVDENGNVYNYTIRDGNAYRDDVAPVSKGQANPLVLVGIGLIVLVLLLLASGGKKHRHH